MRPCASARAGVCGTNGGRGRSRPTDLHAEVADAGPVQPLPLPHVGAAQPAVQHHVPVTLGGGAQHLGRRQVLQRGTAHTHKRRVSRPPRTTRPTAYFSQPANANMPGGAAGRACVPGANCPSTESRCVRACAALRTWRRWRLCLQVCQCWRPPASPPPHLDSVGQHVGVRQAPGQRARLHHADEAGQVEHLALEVLACATTSTTMQGDGSAPLHRKGLARAHATQAATKPALTPPCHPGAAVYVPASRVTLTVLDAAEVKELGAVVDLGPEARLLNARTHTTPAHVARADSRGVVSGHGGAADDTLLRAPSPPFHPPRRRTASSSRRACASATPP